MLQGVVTGGVWEDEVEAILGDFVGVIRAGGALEDVAEELVVCEGAMCPETLLEGGGDC